MIESPLLPIEYVGNGVTLSFGVTIPFFDAAELRVYLRVIATGVPTLLVLDTDYTVTGGNGTTGTVTFGVAPSALQAVVIERLTARTQESDYQNQAAIPAETLEHDFDRAVLRDQEIDREIARAIHFPASDGLTLSSELPNRVDRANSFLTFDVDGNATATLISELAPGSVVVGTPGQGLLPLASFDLWRANLEVVRNLGNMVGVQAGTFAARPTAGLFGSGLYFATDQLRLYRSDGVTWTEAGVGQFTNATLPVASVASRLLLDTDNRILYRDTGVTLAPLRAPLPRGALGGLDLTVAGGNVVFINAGECRAGTPTDRSILNAYLTAGLNKGLNATWAPGNLEGGRAAGINLSPDTEYRVHLLVKPDGSVDAGFDTHADALTLRADAAVVAAGYTRFRRLGSVWTDASSVLLGHTQHGDHFVPLVPSPVVLLTSMPAGSQLLTLPRVPYGVRTLAEIRWFSNSGNNLTLVLSAGGSTITADGSQTASPLTFFDDAGGSSHAGEAWVLTNLFRQVAIRVTNTAPNIEFEVKSYQDARGRWD